MNANEKIVMDRIVKDMIIVPLDVSSLSEVGSLVKELAMHVGCFKIGLQLITAVGTPVAVNFVHGLGGRVFLDGKFDDIPNTVGKASREASNLGVVMFNVHASSGIAAMKKAVENKGQSKVLAVTVLTSLKNKDSYHIFCASSKLKVLQFAKDAKDAGMDGVICSPQELEILKEEEELDDLMRVTPGVRPLWAASDDQERVMTPYEAVLTGADSLVIGRPITNPPKEIGGRVQAVMRITQEISEALERRNQ